MAVMALIVSSITWSCKQGASQNETSDGDTLRMQYAENICITECDGYTKVELVNPWKREAMLHTYLLVKEGDEPTDLPEGTVVKVPLRRSAVYSGVHCSLLDELGRLDAVKAVCDLEYITNQHVVDACRRGDIADLGSSMAPNIETMVDVGPDAILLSPFENSGGYGQVEQLGIPIIECADYMETSALGRAEWVRFYGMLFGCEDEADRLLEQTASKYEALKAKAQKTETHPKVLVEMVTGSTWYVPGGQSTTGRLIVDAGGWTPYGERQESGSIALAPETVFDDCQDADVWFLKYSRPTDFTLTTFGSESPLYSQIKAFKQGRVYGCNLSVVPFYDETPFHPDRLLADMIRMIHPELMDDYSLQYYHQFEAK